ncbi:MAG: hypothetical protein EXR62_00980 [Chloroflexi bacterium]|nr:hypothetical protein [Chloroflexota bacterium]
MRLHRLLRRRPHYFITCLLGCVIILGLWTGGPRTAQALPIAGHQGLAAWQAQGVETTPLAARREPLPANLSLLERLAADKPGLLGQPWFYGLLFGLILVWVFALVALSTDLMEPTRQAGPATQPVGPSSEKSN